MDGCRSREETVARRHGEQPAGRSWHDEDGAAAYEYAILAAVPAIGLAMIMTDFGWSLAVLYEFWVSAIAQVAAML